MTTCSAGTPSGHWRQSWLCQSVSAARLIRQSPRTAEKPRLKLQLRLITVSAAATTWKDVWKKKAVSKIMPILPKIRSPGTQQHRKGSQPCAESVIRLEGPAAQSPSPEVWLILPGESRLERLERRLRKVDLGELGELGVADTLSPSPSLINREKAMRDRRRVDREGATLLDP
mmetsp:Transcript_2171/g.5021  ORF Transcript_2171/g.5021 Transcript_2171/m.5021 type:complete len:173 (+) Transcript_2171:1623-2141(+)